MTEIVCYVYIFHLT